MIIRGVGSPRLAQLALAALICTGLAACGGSGDGSGDGSSDGSVASATPSATGGKSAASAPGGTSSSTSSSSTSSSSTPSSSTPSDKSVTLSWNPPTRNSDGSPLVNLAGYTLHYGTSSQDYTGSIEITSPTKTSYVLSDSNFPPGKYYFAISAYNSEQVSSPLSSEISVTVD